VGPQVKDVLAKGKKRGWKAVHLNGMSLSDNAKVIHLQFLLLPLDSRYRSYKVPWLSDTRVYAPQIRAGLGTTASFCPSLFGRINVECPADSLRSGKLTELYQLGTSDGA
jgi:hypothetical protein